MYATIHPFRHSETERELSGTTDRQPTGARPAGTLELVDLDDRDGTVLLLWPDDATARIAGALVYRVIDQVHGLSSERRPLFAQVMWLNGCGDPALADAAERGGRDRIGPAVSGVEGLVGVLALRSIDHQIVIVVLSTGTEAFEQMSRAILGTALLPGEDPALLPGFDRVATTRVLRAELPAQVRS